MNILVCVKQVPDPELPLSISPDGTWIGHEPKAFKMNHFDRFALEEAVLIRKGLLPEEKTCIDAVSVGPQRVAATLKRALAMGADNANHILLNDDSYMSPFDTASLIASWAKDKSYQLILTGVMAEDDMHCVVGQFIGEILAFACATSVIHQEIMDEGRGIYVEREVESGRRECLRLRLPAVLTLQPGINTPGYPSLSNMLRAADQEILTIGQGELPSLGQRDRLVSLRQPERSSRGVFMEGTMVEKARALVKIFHEKSLI